MGLQCTGLIATVVAGSSKITCKWEFVSDKVAGFDIEWYYQTFTNAKWELGGSERVTFEKYAGAYSTAIDIGDSNRHKALAEQGSDAAKISKSKKTKNKFYFRVKAVPQTYVATVTEGGKQVKKNMPWFSASWSSSQTYVPSAWSEYRKLVASRFDNCEWYREAARSAYWQLRDMAANDYSASTINAQAAKVESYCESCLEFADKTIALCSEEGYTATTSYEMKWADYYSGECAKTGTWYTYAESRKDSSTAADDINYYRGLGKTYRKKADEYWFKAKDCAKNSDSSGESKNYAAAADQYWKAGYNWGQAYILSEVTSDLGEQNENVHWYAVANENAGAAHATTQWTESQLKSMAAKTSTPSVAGGRLANGDVAVAVSCNDNWSDRIVLQRRVDGGPWGTIKTFTRTVPHDGGPWAEQTWTDTTAYHGHTHSYRAYAWRKSIPTSINSDWSTVTVIEGIPEAPTGFQVVKIAEGQVRAAWIAEGYVAGAYELWYSDKETVDESGKVVNPWNAGIPESEMNKADINDGETHAVLSGLADGHWYFRLRRKNSTGTSGWARRYDNSLSNGAVTCYVNMVTLLPALAQPRNLEAAPYTGDPTHAVKLTWEDTLENGASYEVQYSTDANAWANNALDAITTIKYAGDQGRTYTITGLEAGKTYGFRIKKVRENSTATWSTLKSGAASTNGVAIYTAILKLEATPASSVAAPTNPAAVASGTSIKVTFTSTQAADETYEIERTMVSGALAANDYGVIETTQISAYTTKNAKTYTFTDLEPGKYWFRIRKVKGDAFSAWTSTVAATITAAAAAETLVQPKGMYARVSGTNITLNWTDVRDTDATYEIWYAKGFAPFRDNIMSQITIEEIGDLASQTGDAWFYTLADLEQGTTYYLRLRKKKGDSFKWAAVKAGDQSVPKDGNISVAVKTGDAPSPSIATPTNLAAETRDDESIRLSWNCSAASGDAFEIEWTDDSTAFDDNVAGAIDSAAMDVEASSSSHIYSISGLNPGTDYWARVRKRAGDDAGAWTDDVKGTTAHSKEQVDDLGAPIPAAMLAGYDLDSEVVLSWTHNSKSNAAQTRAQIKLIVIDADGGTFEKSYSITGDTPVKSIIPSSIGMEDGSSCEWNVRTQGSVTGLWSPWSAIIRFSVYAKPSVQIGLTDGSGDPVGGSSELAQLPLNVSVDVSNPSTQNPPISFGISVMSAEAYDAQSVDGTVRHVAAGEPVWSGTIDANDDGFSTSGWTVALGTPEVNFESGRSYTAVGSVATAQGMREQSEPADFTARFDGEVPQPIARLEFDEVDLACTIYPICAEPSEEEDVGWLDPIGFSCSITGVSCDKAYDNGDGTATCAIVVPSGYEALFIDSEPFGINGTSCIAVLPYEEAAIALSENGIDADDTGTIEIEGVAAPIPDEEEQPEDPYTSNEGLTPEEAAAVAEHGVPEEPEIIIESENPYPADVNPTYDPGTGDLVEGILLDVYRVCADGELVEIAIGLPNDGQTGCMDPHPDFGTATYRVVARDPETGIASAADASISNEVNDVVIQWNESWDEAGYAGERLRLAYNLKVDEKYKIDSSLREYAGRKHPVSYYGTQLGQTSTIAGGLSRKLDGEKLELARRLAAYRGDCYVREPSGLGYWANVDVSIGSSYANAAVDVSFNITRVEGAR